MDNDWMAQGKCRDMDPAVFFPSDGIGVQIAQRICSECPVKGPCLEYALDEQGGPRRMGRHLRARASPHPAPASDVEPAGQPQLTAPGAPGARDEPSPVLECVVNVSEGRDLASWPPSPPPAPSALLDVHSDHDHHRSVLTLAGPAPTSRKPYEPSPGPRSSSSTSVTTSGVHPRLGALDVVPFVPLEPRRQPCRARRATSVRPSQRARPLRRLGRRRARVARASATGPSAPCPRCGATPSARLAPDTGPTASRTPARGRAQSVPAARWWPTTCGSPPPT